MILQDKVAIVTGGARGIGRAISLAMAKEGARVVVNYVSNSEAATRVVEEIHQEGGEAISIQADVSDSLAVQRMVETTLSRFGRIDILVNNAGIATGSFVVDMPEEDWDKVIDTNLKGVFLCCKAVLPTMIQQRQGKIINIASLVAHTGSYQHAHYAASKAAVIAFTMSLAKEVGPYNINVNAIGPGRIATAMEAERQARERARWISETPLGRLGRPEEIASVAVFLASEAASFITGETINATGGIWMGT
ncbi:MAG: 3-oxoacyl-ACP reductase FabG [Chloroflexi bacterium]|nr:3-oxoacyl-ACP reductase FabG [Chloroflexota bacterium]